MQAWFDAPARADRKDVRFRSVDSVPIDSFYFSTFFGGSTAEWAPPEDEYIDFDDIVVSTKPITHENRAAVLQARAGLAGCTGSPALVR